MATTRQRSTTKRNTKKARTGRSSASGRRAKPGSTGQGSYYHVEVRPTSGFVTFRTQDVGGPGHIQRVAGKRASGSWSTVKWLISKEDAHVSGGTLVADTREARKLLGELGSQPVRLTGDRFEAGDRPDVPEDTKPTPAQQRARRENLRKAQAVRRKK